MTLHNDLQLFGWLMTSVHPSVAHSRALLHATHNEIDCETDDSAFVNLEAITAIGLTRCVVNGGQRVVRVGGARYFCQCSVTVRIG
ncbi:hypothetical protein BD309DRAFT_975664 [Dichomitus squalens]|nr:hypothetical protein BD309DRAFT_975664 [Dichomitus squalens]